MTRPSYDVPAARKLVRLARVLGEAQKPLGLTELAEAIGTNKNMAYRLLITLGEEGWVIGEGSPPKYRLSLLPFHIFSGPVNRMDLKRAAAEPLRRLHQETGESCYLSVRAGDKALHLEFLDGVGEIRIGGRLGGHYDLHCTAMGKVLMAGLPEDELERLVKHGLARHTPRTIVDPAALRAHLAQVRRQDYAFNREEFGRGLLGVAAPVRDRAGRVAGAIGLSVPIFTHTPQDVRRRLLPAVRAAARQASHNLGGLGGEGS